MMIISADAKQTRHVQHHQHGIAPSIHPSPSIRCWCQRAGPVVLDPRHAGAAIREASTKPSSFPPSFLLPSLSSLLPHPLTTE